MIAEAHKAPAVLVCRHVEWPTAMERQLQALPRRWLLRSEQVSAVLTGMRAGEAASLGPWAQACLLVVTFGQLHCVTSGTDLSLQEGDSLVVTPGLRHEFRASEIADFLLMNLTPPGAWLNRCLCHGTAGRQKILATAAQLFGLDAHV